MHEIKTQFGEPGFLVLAGSRLFGIDGPDSDYDYIGATIESEDHRLGLSGQFEQETFEGENFEGTIYSLWKLTMLLMTGNPTIVTTMFADPIRDDYGICTPSFRQAASSRKAGRAFMGYMTAQRQKMLGQKTGTNRPALISTYGFDTKFAGHMIRLGYQGCEYLETGTITLPMPDESTTAGCALNVREIRDGHWTLDRIIGEAEALEARLERAYDNTSLPAEPDVEWLNDWLVDKYLWEYSDGS
jgi:hypothetical protein